MTTHQTAPTQFITAGPIKFAYRRFGTPSSLSVPLLFLTHFRGTMDYWDPLLINSLSSTREIILVDNAGIGLSSGSVDDTVPKMASQIVNFLAALKIEKVDILGFSMGGFVAPLVYLDGPRGLVRKMVLAGTGTTYGEGVVESSAERQEVVKVNAAGKEAEEENFQVLFFLPTETSRAAGHAWYERMTERNASTSGEERTEFVSTNYADGAAGMMAMLNAMTRLGDPAFRSEGSYDRLGQIDIPVLVLQGKDDIMIPTVNSFVLQQKLPSATLKIFPDSGHGVLYQHTEEVVEDINRFLNK